MKLFLFTVLTLLLTPLLPGQIPESQPVPIGIDLSMKNEKLQIVYLGEAREMKEVEAKLKLALLAEPRQPVILNFNGDVTLETAIHFYQKIKDCGIPLIQCYVPDPRNKATSVEASFITPSWKEIFDARP
jgi:hypothetical protein